MQATTAFDQENTSHRSEPRLPAMTTPFPILPMSVLVLSLLSTWIVDVSLSSYAGFLVLHLGMIVDNRDQVGYAVGSLMAATLAGRMVGVYFWGVTADRYGRRPVIFVSLWSTAAFAVAFGFSTTFFWALAFRFLLGMLNGLTALWSTLVAEICGKEHEVVGTGMITTAWSLGVFGGSGLGGILAEPAINFPSIFSTSGIFERFPYLLPNVAGASLAILALPLVYLFLPETLPAGNTGKTATTHGPGEKLVKETSLLAEPRVRPLLILYGLYMFVSHLENLFSLWALSTVDKGGLDWSAEQIGQAFLACGALVILFELVMMRFLLGRFGTKMPVRAATLIIVPVTALIPSLSSLQGEGSLLTFAVVAALFAIYSCLDLCITGIFLAINNATTPERLGELNGIAATVASAAAMVGPAAWSALFSYSIESNRPFPFDYHLTFYAKAALRFVVACLAWNMSKIGHDAQNGLKDGGRHIDEERQLDQS